MTDDPDPWGLDDDDDHDQRHRWWIEGCPDCVDRAERLERERS